MIQYITVLLLYLRHYVSYIVTMNTEIPILSNNEPLLPDSVPLVASFHDDRNRLSYQYPLLQDINGVRTPLTYFIPVEGSIDSHIQIEYREITRLMQKNNWMSAFVRSDFTSGKYDGEVGSKITSQDPHSIEQTVLELVSQVFFAKRYLGSRIAIREWIPHTREVRYFIRDGDILYWDSEDNSVTDDEVPTDQAEKVAKEFTTYSWGVDFIQHSETGDWYCIEMGLNGLYYSYENSMWVEITEHTNSTYDLESVEDMPTPELL